MWMLDTGSGHDLVNKAMADGYETKRLSKPLTFSTAGGHTQSYCTVPMYSQAMGGHIAPYLLPPTPPVLSIGKRCMEEGFAFHWEAGEEPYLVTPDGGCIALKVDRNIPFLDNTNAFYSLCPSLAVEKTDRKTAPDAIAMGDVNVDSPDKDDHDKPDEMIGEMPGEQSIADAAEEDKPKGDSKSTSKLREEANSLVHKLTHLPKNPFCEACKRGKMKEKYSRRGAFKHVLEKWGEIITFDYLYSGSGQIAPWVSTVRRNVWSSRTCTPVLLWHVRWTVGHTPEWSRA